MEKVDAELNGILFVVIEPGDRIGQDHCAMIIYKDPARVPRHYLERLGIN